MYNVFNSKQKGLISDIKLFTVLHKYTIHKYQRVSETYRSLLFTFNSKFEKMSTTT